MVKKVLPLITLLCVVVMVVAVLMIVGEVKDRQKEIDDFDKLSVLVADVTVFDETQDTTEPKNSESNAEPETTHGVSTRNLMPLFEKNADCIGWVMTSNLHFLSSI